MNEVVDLISMLYFFFFKQKPAYEMLISDWSSDVCSSGLMGSSQTLVSSWQNRTFRADLPGSRRICPSHRRQTSGRSEEHTSELQSLMRISYAVFCLKKKKTQKTKYETKNI